MWFLIAEICQQTETKILNIAQRVIVCCERWVQLLENLKMEGGIQTFQLGKIFPEKKNSFVFRSVPSAASLGGSGSEEDPASTLLNLPPCLNLTKFTTKSTYTLWFAELKIIMNSFLASFMPAKGNRGRSEEYSPLYCHRPKMPKMYAPPVCKRL